jgi:antitoxin component YwqK of YwqJK toxin-antitoxin module
MLTNYILPDVLQYVFNLYIDWTNDELILSKFVNFKFDIKPHRNFNCYWTTRTIKVVRIYIDDNVVKEERFIDGQKHKFKEDNYKNNKLDGSMFEWHDNGGLAVHANFKYGKLDGKIFEWNDNGILISEENYKCGKKDGDQYKYHSNGVIFNKSCYEKGNMTKNQSYTLASEPIKVTIKN